MRISDWSSDVCSSDLLALDHRRAFEIMADRQLLGDADATVGLDRILADKLRAARDLALAGRDRGHALVRGQVQLQRAHDRHRTRLLDLHEHVDHAVRSEEHTSELQSLIRNSYAV